MINTRSVDALPTRTIQFEIDVALQTFQLTEYIDSVSRSTDENSVFTDQVCESGRGRSSWVPTSKSASNCFILHTICSHA